MSAKQATPPKQNTFSAQVPAGMPGMLQYLGFVAGPPAKDAHQPIQGGGAGLYKVVLTLARPGQPLLPEGQVTSFENMHGDSHLAIADPAYHPPTIAVDDGVTSILFQAETEDGKFNLVGKPNARGFLGQIIAEEMQGEDAQDARTKVYRALASSLSNISIQLDMPFFVYQSDMIELSTGNRFISIISPHLERPMQIAPTGTMSKDFRSLVALYREALSSNTPPFQFLCYFKILEGIKKRRQQLIAEAKAAGTEVPKPPVQIVYALEASRAYHSPEICVTAGTILARLGFIDMASSKVECLGAVDRIPRFQAMRWRLQGEIDAAKKQPVAAIQLLERASSLDLPLRATDYLARARPFRRCGARTHALRRNSEAPWDPLAECGDRVARCPAGNRG